MSRKDKARTVYVTSSDTNIHASSAGDRNGGIAKVAPAQVVPRDTPAAQTAAATHTAASEPAVVQRCDMVLLLCFVYFTIIDITYFLLLHMQLYFRKS